MTGAPLTIVMVTHNSAAVLPKALLGLKGQFPVIQVDNASRDETREIARRQDVTLIENERNIGYGRGCNQGARLAETPYILFMNPDVEITPEAIEVLLETTENFPDAAAFGPRVIEHDGTELYRWTNFLQQGRVPKPDAAPEASTIVPVLSGSVFLIRRHLFEELNGFDENIFLYFEEDDLFHRIIDNGYQLTYVPEAHAIHTAGRSSPRNFRSTAFRHHHYGWSQCYIADKHGLSYEPAREKWKYLRRFGSACVTLNPSRMAINWGRYRGIKAWLANRTASTVN